MDVIVSKRSLFNRVQHHLHIWGSARQNMSDFRDLNDIWSVFYETLIVKQRGGLDWTKRHRSYVLELKTAFHSPFYEIQTNLNVRSEKEPFSVLFCYILTLLLNAEVVHVCYTENWEKFCFNLNFNKEFLSLGGLLCSCLCQIWPPAFVF